MSYAGSVHQSVRAASAWRFACLVLAVGTVALAAVAMHATGVQRTVLVPYGLMSANGEIRVDGQPEKDGQYLALLARADLAAMLNWQPKTIDAQLNGFLARLSPAAYAKYNISLRNNAKKYGEMNISEVFYPQTVKYTVPDTVIITGMLVRYAGDTQTMSTHATYTMTYTIANGIYAIAEVETGK